MDQQIGKTITFNVTYLYTRGVHQYLTDNVTAPEFDPATYSIVGPCPPLTITSSNPAGFSPSIRSSPRRMPGFGIFLSMRSYTYTDAKSDTQGVTYFPSISQHPGLDFGRPSFGYSQPPLFDWDVCRSSWNHLCSSAGSPVGYALQSDDRQ